jgi:hypothetical protein
MFVSAALGLIVYGVVELTGGHVTSTSTALTKVGAAGLVVCYAFLLGWALLSWRLHRQSQSPAYEMGTKVCQQSLFIQLSEILMWGAVVVWSPRRYAIHRNPPWLRCGYSRTGD